MKNSIIGLLLVLILLLALLCLKSSMMEYFTQKDPTHKKLSKLIKNLEKKYKLGHIKEKCSREYNNVINDSSSREKIMDLLKTEDLSSLMLIQSPKEIVELRDCALDNF